MSCGVRYQIWDCLLTKIRTVLPAYNYYVNPDITNYKEIKKEWSCKPGSVIARKCRDDHLSRLHVAIQLKRPTWRRTGQIHGPLFGLASDGVYNASCVTTRPVVSYTAFSPLPESMRYPAVCFLLHFPGSRLRRTLSGILPCEARTFLTHLRAIIRSAR